MDLSAAACPHTANTPQAAKGVFSVIQLPDVVFFFFINQLPCGIKLNPATVWSIFILQVVVL